MDVDFMEFLRWRHDGFIRLHFMETIAVMMDI